MTKPKTLEIGSPERIQWLVENRAKLMDAKHDFAVKHGFAYKRSQDFRDCIVIRWKTSRVKYKIVHPRIVEYVKVCHALSDKYNLLKTNGARIEDDK